MTRERGGTHLRGAKVPFGLGFLQRRSRLVDSAWQRPATRIMASGC